MSETRNSSLLEKVTVFFVICCLVMGSFVVNTAVALDGSGTQQDPWLIKSLVNFNEFAADENYWDDYTRLETDVNLAGLTYSTAVIAPDTDNSNQWVFNGTAFTGVFDGNDHKILNLTIDDGGVGNDYLGLFGYIGNGEVKNLGIEDGSISGDIMFGGLVGSNGTQGNPGGVISNCYSTGDVSGDYAIGGLLGGNFGIVSDCYSTADVTCNIGGRNAGGLVGVNDGSVSNSYSTGNVSGFIDVGGLLGDNTEDSNVSNCYSTGDVSGATNVGGLVGYNELGSLSNCFWDTETQTNGVTESIGLNSGTSTNVEGLPTSQLHQQSTFTDWDFINVWDIGENQTYPYLRVYLAGDINKDGIVNFFDFAIEVDKWMEGN